MFEVGYITLSYIEKRIHFIFVKYAYFIRATVLFWNTVSSIILDGAPLETIFDGKDMTTGSWYSHNRNNALVRACIKIVLKI